MAIFDYDSLIKDALYRGTYVREGKEDVSHVGKFLGISPEQMLKIMQDPNGKCRQVALLCEDDKYEKGWRYFEPETLILVEDLTDNG
jgi:hypothetical protein